MNINEFLQSEIGQYITASLDRGETMQDIIHDLKNPTLDIEEMLATSLQTHCTPEEIEQYIESDMLYECTPHGRYLQQCIQYAIDNSSLIYDTIQSN